MKASDVDNSVLVKWMAVNRPSFTNFFGQIDPDHIYNIKITSWLNYRFDNGYTPIILFNVFLPPSKQSVQDNLLQPSISHNVL